MRDGLVDNVLSYSSSTGSWGGGPPQFEDGRGDRATRGCPLHSSSEGAGRSSAINCASTEGGSEIEQPRSSPVLANI